MINIAGCSDIVVFFACIGLAVLYALIGLLVAFLVKEVFTEEGDEDELLFVFAIILWPVFLAVMVLMTIAMWIFTPLWAATKRDLRDTERRLSDRIQEECSEPICYSEEMEEDLFDKSFKVGDIITGTIPQTDNHGKNISYEHLYQGCKCRVLSIGYDGSMRVILIDHKDKEAHKSVIGEVFTAPSRNFTLVKAPAKKRKIVKTKKSRR